ncbi:ArsA family ATPase [Bacillus alveayuensis]|uniref:ArsA family ATPase n=1 Tax=Aeribacillus alveayuensis TaxID=279215 RepID=UPI0005CD4C1C|nr:ArsA family ATPase [Bacillus alveayuensis]
MTCQVYFVGGKGGVGKSTTAAALAYRFSKEGKNTLLVSTDPAHNLADLFQQKEKKGQYIPVQNGLTLFELDPDQETVHYINQVKENMKGLVKATMIDEVHRQLDLVSSSPGAQEAAVFERMTTILIEERNKYDAIIFDTAPTGHTIRLLVLPELMGIWMDGLLERRRKVQENYSQLLYDGEVREDPIYEVLQRRKRKFAQVRELLKDSETTHFLFVLNPERLPILETKKAVEQLQSFGMNVKIIVVNKVIPEANLDSFWSKRKEVERAYLDEIKTIFSIKHLCYIPLLSNDIRSLSDIEAYAKYLELPEMLYS